jgi:hypothetical protein
MNRYSIKMIIAMGLLASNASSADPQRTTVNVNGSAVASYIGLPIKLVDVSQKGFTYAYGPSVINASGQHYAYFCSTGTLNNPVDWDHVRNSTSSNLEVWTSPVTQVAPNSVERAACDPSVVRYNAGDGLFYYMVYSGAAYNVQTLNFVARSTSPGGPFLKYTDRGTWESNPPDPHAIVWPNQSSPEGSGIYGAGQASLVVRNGVVYQWYMDVTIDGQTRVLLVTSTDMIHWSSPVVTDVINQSVDVKYSPTYGVFVMFEIVNTHEASAQLAIRTSSNGVNWSAPQVVCGIGCFPDWANNVGVSGDDQGQLIPGKILVAYGAPYDLSPSYRNDGSAPYKWGYWDLYGQFLGLGSYATGSQGEKPTFRYANLSSGKHLYSSNPNEAANGWHPENAGWPLFSVFSSPFSGSKPLYQCRSNVGSYFLSNFANCEGASYVGLHGYIYSSQVSGSSPLYRLYRSANADFIVSLDPNEGTSIGYTLQGMMGYAPP